MLNILFALCMLLALVLPLQGAEGVLIVGSDSPAMQEVKRAVARDLGSHQVENFTLKADTSYDQLKAELLRRKPRAVLLLDNRSVQLMQKLHKEKDSYLSQLPASATMALNLKHILEGETKISGIEYEAPAFSILTQFRRLVDIKLSRVLVIYRPSQFQKVFQEAQIQLAREGVQLIGLNAEAEGDDATAIARFIDKNLKEDHANDKVDAFLVLTDNKLLNNETFGPLWVSRARNMKIPFLCGIENFVSEKLRFCTFAAYPDHNDLAHQASEQIMAMIDDGVSPAEIGVDYLVSVKMAIDASRLNSMGLKLKEPLPVDIKIIP